MFSKVYDVPSMIIFIIIIIYNKKHSQQNKTKRKTNLKTLINPIKFEEPTRDIHTLLKNISDDYQKLTSTKRSCDCLYLVLT